MISNLEYYRIFYTVAKKGSFTAAANVLMTSQPALSRSVKLLEEDLGCTLFRRSSRGVRLTPEGEQLMAFVENAYQEMRKAEELMARLNEYSEGSIRICASATSLLTYLLDRIGVFREMYPHVRLHILNNNAAESIDRVRSGDVDFAVVSSPFDSPSDLKGVKLKQFHDLLMCGRRFMDIAGKELTLRQISEQPVISVSEGTAIRRFYDRLFLSHRCVFSPEIEVASVEMLLPMVIHNLGIAFVPEIYLSEIVSDDVFVVNVKEEIPDREIWLFYRDDATLSLAAEKFLEFLSDKKVLDKEEDGV